MLSHLMFCFFHTRSWLVPHAHVSAKLIDCILLSSLALNAVLITSSVNALCFSLLDFYCDFNIDFIVFCEIFMIFSKSFYIKFTFFYLVYFTFKLSCFLTTFIIFEFKLFVPFAFLHYHLLNRNMFLVSMRQIISLFLHLIHLSLIQIFFQFFL